MTTMNLLQRINKVREEVAYIQKDKSVSTGSSSYKAVTHDMVTAQTRSALIKHGVVSWPNLVESTMHEPHQLDKDKINRQWRYDATYDFTFANVDDPQDRITIRIEAHAMDNADKAPGKALSYAKKYALLKLLDIETGEDEESRVPEEFDCAPYIVQIEGCETLEGLKVCFQQAFAAAGRDDAARRAITAAKDKRKAELAK